MTSPRIRVLVTAFAPVPGGSPHAAALASMAAALHAELDLVTVKTERLTHLERFGDARMLRVPVTVGSQQDQLASFGRAVSRQLDTQPYDVVHVRGAYEGVVAAVRKRELGYRLVYEIATFASERDGREAEDTWLDAHERCLEAADMILVPSQAAGRSLSELGWGGKVAVLAPGVDIDAYDWWPSVPGEVARLLYVGPFDSDRDIGTVLNAMRELAKRRRVHVLMAGEPEAAARDRLRRLVEAFGLSSVIQVRGDPRPPMLPSLIAACDAALAPAAATPRFRELGDIPQPLLEYMACRRPIIAAGVPGVAEVMRDEREGLLYMPGDETSLIEAFETLFDTPDLKERLVDAAYERARRRFAGGMRRRRLAEIYETLVPESQRFDSWYAAFDEEDTGALHVPTTFFHLPDPSPWTTAAASVLDSVAIRTPGEGEETNPEVTSDSGSIDLANVPTAVDDESSIPSGEPISESPMGTSGSSPGESPPGGGATLPSLEALPERDDAGTREALAEDEGAPTGEEPAPPSGMVYPKADAPVDDRPTLMDFGNDLEPEPDEKAGSAGEEPQARADSSAMRAVSSEAPATPAPADAKKSARPKRDTLADPIRPIVDGEGRPTGDR